MTVLRCIFVLGWLKTWGQWHPLLSTQCPLLAWSGTVEFVSLFVSFYKIVPNFTAALQIRSPHSELASWSAYVWNGSGINSKNITSEEKIRKWPTQSPFLEAGALAGDQSYALRPNLSAVSVCESPQIPISKNVGLEAKLIKTAKLKFRKCGGFFKTFFWTDLFRNGFGKWT